MPQVKLNKILALALVFILVFPSVSLAKHYGPLWAVWTHSEDSRECAAKTVFWFTLALAIIVLIAKRVDWSKMDNFPVEDLPEVDVEKYGH